MLRPLVVVSLAATVGLPALSQAQAQVQVQDDFHWSGTVAAGKTVRISNVSGNIKVSPSTSGKVEVVGLEHGDPTISIASVPTCRKRRRDSRSA